MIYFDDVFYKEYKDTNKPVTLVTRDGDEFTAILKDTDEGRKYFVGDDIVICYTSVVWDKYELDRSEYAGSYVHRKHIDYVKAVALREDIRTSLLNTIESFVQYHEYYKSQDMVFTIYAIDNYDVRQEIRSPIIGKFVERNGRLEDFKEHKLQGIAPSTEYHNRVITTSVEAWRYRALPWNEIREICPEFVQQVLNGQEP